ncbi:MAG: hypothetical protein IJN63_03945 [Clostridia bacterium]|nr:hypothetical protein [Clostridia bacterium]
MKRNYILNYLCGLFAVILLFVGVGVFVINLKAPADPIILADADFTKIEALDYCFGEFCIVDAYSYTGSSQEDAEEYFCYAIALDKYGNTQAISFSIDKDDNAFNAVKQYANDPEGDVGDCVIECYAKARSLKAWSPTLLEYFDEIVTGYSEESGISVYIPLDFEFICGPLTDFAEMRREQMQVPRIAATVCTVIGGLLAVAAFLIPGIKTYSAVPKEEGPPQAETTAEDGTSNE